MAFRATGCCAVLIVATLLSPGASAAPVCEGAGCPAAVQSKSAKPLDIMKFMREQAASTRVSKTRSTKPRPVDHARRPAASSVAARSAPARSQTRLPVEAASSFASQPEQAAPAVASDELSTADRAAAPAPAETVGAAPSDSPNVQIVDADEFNDIDRKAYDGLLAEAARLRADAQGRDEQQPGASPANPSWLQWIWSATAGTLAALSAAVHQLLG